MNIVLIRVYMRKKEGKRKRGKEEEGERERGFATLS